MLGKKLAFTGIVVALVAIILAPSAHAQVISTRSDQASYTPGGTGTLYITIVNDDPQQTLEIRNLTVYFPWAGYVDGKWASGGNVTINLAPYKVLTSASSPGGGNVYVNSVQFNIPSWYGQNSFGNCPDSTHSRYGIYSGCVLLGSNQNNLEYQGSSYGIAMAIPTYHAPSFMSTIIPTASFIILVGATCLLFLWYTSLKRLENKNP